ncbi:MAG: hypothetical protein HZB33_05890, partial [Nitrospirae bacterium]|nr:hypothetical protein [Nitrospirota bacterium]
MARGQEVKTKGGKAEERHRAMEGRYHKALEEYLGLIESLAPVSSGNKPIIEKLKTLLDTILPKAKRPLLGSLPYRDLNYPSKEPYQGAPVVPAYKGGGSKEVTPEDTMDTEEAPLSSEIAEFAQSLDWKPVAIYEYVKNNIETEWYWGCMKGAEETLRQKSGNDCDQATLLAALLRASGFPTRYVRGTIEFFAGRHSVIDKIKNLTGIEDPMKIAGFFQKSGIPYRPIIQGGKITNFEIEHIWVESRIPYGNYRGTMIDDSDPTWLGLDTSIKVKGYAYNNPRDIMGVVQLAGLRDIYLNADNTLTPLEYVKESIEGYLTQSYPMVTYNDLLKTRTLVPETMKILPASMQFEQKMITHEYTEIPEELRHKVRIIANTPGSPEPLFDLQSETFQLSNRRIALSYEPETVEDQEIIDSYGGLDNTPSYLIRLRPVLKLDDEMIVAGRDGLQMGEEHSLTIELISPNGTEKITNTHITGNLAAIGIVAGKVTPSNS